MTLDESMHPVICAACNKEAPVGSEGGPTGETAVTPEQLHGLGWMTAASGRGWVCQECAPAGKG